MRLTDIPEIARLSTPEKILLVEDLWDSIAKDESSLAVPQTEVFPGTAIAACKLLILC
ncbi:addiction module protein, partial [Thermodesulfobacteriota bacterium]